MIRKLGGGRILDYGPSAAVHSRGRVPAGVMVSQATPPALNGRFTTTGMGGSIVRKLTDSPEQAERRKAKARVAYAAFLAQHSDCECHELYGGQPRRIGYRERELDRSRLKREMRA